MKRRSDAVNKEKWIDWVTGRVQSKTLLLITRATINWKEEISAKNEVALEDVAGLHWDSTFKLISLEVKKIKKNNSWNISMALIRSIHLVQTLNRLHEKKNLKNAIRIKKKN